jgi:hypothetical protein
MIQILIGIPVLDDVSRTREYPWCFFDEDFTSLGIAEDLEFFLGMERILRPAW